MKSIFTILAVLSLTVSVASAQEDVPEGSRAICDIQVSGTGEASKLYVTYNNQSASPEEGGTYLTISGYMPIPVPATLVEVRKGKTIIQADLNGVLVETLTIFTRKPLGTDKKRYRAEFVVKADETITDKNAICKIYDPTLIK